MKNMYESNFWNYTFLKKFNFMFAIYFAVQKMQQPKELQLCEKGTDRKQLKSVYWITMPPPLNGLSSISLDLKKKMPVNICLIYEKWCIFQHQLLDSFHFALTRVHAC